MRCLMLKTLLKNSYRANLNIDGSGAVVAAPDQNTPGKIFPHTNSLYICLSRATDKLIFDQ